MIIQVSNEYRGIIKSRDRPMRRTKILKYVAIVMSVVLSISTLSLFADVFGGGSRANSDLSIPAYTDMGITGESVDIWTAATRSLYNDSDTVLVLDPFNADSNGLFSYYNGVISFSDLKSYGVANNTYTSMWFTDGELYNSGIPIAEYDRIDIEYDLYKVSGKNILPCLIYMHGRGDGATGQKARCSTVRVQESYSGSDTFSIVFDDGASYTGNSFRIRYSVYVNKSDINDSTLSVYVNDTFVTNTVHMGLSLFGESRSLLSDVRLDHFAPTGTEAALGFANMTITVYELPEN